MAMSNGGETGGKRPGFGVFDGLIMPHHLVPMDLPVRQISCNYVEFGDMKFVPGIPEHQLDNIVRVCPLKVRSTTRS
ncbi:hypothetical protein R1flu_023337 [Riccia fluitans]|uniref:Uncharacterized protein n=1 Tax=Riccia fluitans TaxID=41844 RepID=A0ABD1XRR2_9MARC